MPPGTCDCIKSKAKKLKRIMNKAYDSPLSPVIDGNTSNSNAVGSTLLRCCGVVMTPTQNLTTVETDGTVSTTTKNLSAPGWGDSPAYKCCVQEVIYPGNSGFGPVGVPIVITRQKRCYIGCKDLE